MSKTAATLIWFFLGFAIISCNQESNEKKIIGKWEGKIDNTCPDRMFTNGAKSANNEFNSNGKVSWGFTGNNGETDNTVTMSDMTYKITGDSLIFLSAVFSDSTQSRIASLMKFDSQNNLLLTREYTDTLDGKTSNCKVTIQLHRKSSTNG